MPPYTLVYLDKIPNVDPRTDECVHKLLLIYCHVSWSKPSGPRLRAVNICMYPKKQKDKKEFYYGH